MRQSHVKDQPLKPGDGTGPLTQIDDGQERATQVLEASGFWASSLPAAEICLMPPGQTDHLHVAPVCRGEPAAADGMTMKHSASCCRSHAVACSEVQAQATFSVESDAPKKTLAGHE